MAKILTELYAKSPVDNATHLTANAKQLHTVAKKRDKTISLRNVKSFLQNQDVYTLNRSVTRNFKRNHYYVNYINDLWQIDLADVSQYAKQNDNYKYLVIDVLTKYAFVKPLQIKLHLRSPERSVRFWIVGEAGRKLCRQIKGANLKISICKHC